MKKLLDKKLCTKNDKALRRFLKKQNLDIKSKLLECDICNFNYEFKDIFHFSGILKDELQNHIHVCQKCIDKLELKVNLNFDWMMVEKFYI